MSRATDPEVREREIGPGSDRTFGLVFAAVFAFIALWPILRGHSPRLIGLAIATAFGLASLFAPSLLRPLNYTWFRLGLLLHRVVSPVVMGGVFFLCITPMGVALRLFGKDLLSLKRRADLGSYWIPRTPVGPEPQTMKRPF